MSPHTLLIDVRSAAEFATGHLTSDMGPTLNIEYQAIDQLPAIYAENYHAHVTKHHDITLYCRSGRRSNIALQTLRGLGFVNVRDIGGFEDARRVLDREVVGKQLEEGMRGGEMGKEEGESDKVKEKRREGFGAVVEGLKALEG